MYDKIIKDADNMLNGYYVFDGIWDMEPCEEPVNNKNIRWDIKYNNDKEWSYEFTRMDYLYKLVIAYEQTNDKKYINHGFIIINKWYKNNKKYLYKRVGKINNRLFKNLGHRSLDISIMISNILDYKGQENKLLKKWIELNKPIVEKITIRGREEVLIVYETKV